MTTADRGDPPWLNDDQLADWRSLLAMVMLLPPALDLQLKRDAGINGFEYHVMSSLSVAPGRSRSMSELAVLAQGSLSRLSHAVTRLERSGWVERRSLDGDRRVEARLTDAGMAKMEQTAPGHVSEARRLVVDALTPEQLQSLGSAARTVVARIDEQVCRALVSGAGSPTECAAVADVCGAAGVPVDSCGAEPQPGGEIQNRCESV